MAKGWSPGHDVVKIERQPAVWRRLLSFARLLPAARSKRLFLLSDRADSSVMKTLIFTITAFVFLLLSSVSSPGKLPPKSTEFQGTIATINEASITVKSAKGTRAFAIYPGTVFGQRASGKLANFKPGDPVIVVFSESAGQTKAENIRNPELDKKKPAKKKKGAAKKK
jgi:hypothetical protein